MSFFGKIRFRFGYGDKFRYFPVSYGKVYLDSGYKYIDYSYINYIDLKTGDFYKKKIGDTDINDNNFIPILVSYCNFVEANIEKFDVFAIELINRLVICKLQESGSSVRELVPYARKRKDY